MRSSSDAADAVSGVAVRRSEPSSLSSLRAQCRVLLHAMVTAGAVGAVVLALVLVSHAWMLASNAPPLRSAALSGGAALTAPIGSSIEGVWWMMQLSDLHLRVFEPARTAALHRALDHDVAALSPCFVAVTGDLVDAKSFDFSASVKFVEEWSAYRNASAHGVHVVSSAPARHYACGYAHAAAARFPPPWLDMRGNHDAFDTESASARDLFVEHAHVAATGLLAAQHERDDPASGDGVGYSYSLDHRTEDGSVFRFVFLDACLRPGPHRPLNFFGMVTRRGIDFLRDSLARAPESAGGEGVGSPQPLHAFVLSHYPLSFLSSAAASDGRSYRDIEASSRVTMHLSGHLHTLLGLAPTAYARRPGGSLELELADFRLTRRARVLAFDHGVVSFVDFTLNTPGPVAVVTMPKDARFLTDREPLAVMRRASHVRALVFERGNDCRVDSVAVQLVNAASGAIVSVALQRVQDGHPLHTGAWDPSAFARGRHRLTLHAHDTCGHKTFVEQTFSLDGTPAPLFSPISLLLSGSVTETMEVLHYGVLAALVVILLAGRLVGAAVIVVARTRFVDASRALALAPRTCCARGVAWMRVWLWLIVVGVADFCASSALFASTLGVVLALGVGPVLVGELLTGQLGVAFAWALMVEGRYVHSADRFLFALPRVLLAVLPTLLHAAVATAHAHVTESLATRKGSGGAWLGGAGSNTVAFVRHVVLPMVDVRAPLWLVYALVFGGWHAFVVYDIWQAYGPWTIVSPGTSWLLAWMLALGASRVVRVRRAVRTAAA